VYFAYPIKADEIEVAIVDLAKQGAQALVAIQAHFCTLSATALSLSHKHTAGRSFLGHAAGSSKAPF
jgi:hypothetical protein